MQLHQQGLFYRHNSNQFPDNNLSEEIKTVIEHNRSIQSRLSKNEGLKYVTIHEKEFNGCHAKIKFKGRLFGSIRIGVKKRQPTSTEQQLLGDDCQEILSPKKNSS